MVVLIKLSAIFAAVAGLTARTLGLESLLMKTVFTLANLRRIPVVSEHELWLFCEIARDLNNEELDFMKRVSCFLEVRDFLFCENVKLQSRKLDTCVNFKPVLKFVDLWIALGPRGCRRLRKHNLLTIAKIVRLHELNKILDLLISKFRFPKTKPIGRKLAELPVLLQILH